MAEFVFRASLVETVLILCVGAVTIALSFMGHRRGLSQFKYLAWGLKAAAVAMVCVLLMRPERKLALPHKQLERLLVVVDSSESMETLDESLEGRAVTRTVALRDFLQSSAWLSFKDASSLQVVEKSIGLEGEGETDISSAFSGEDTADLYLLLSDGAWNAGESPVVVAQQKRKEEIPVFSLSFGLEEEMADVVVDALRVPFYVETAEEFSIIASLHSSFGKEMNVEVLLKKDGEVILRKEHALQPRGETEVSFPQKLALEGEVEYAVEVVPVAGEATEKNNERRTSVVAKDQSIKVLLVDTLPRWEYRYIRNAMMRDEKVEVSCILFHPHVPLTSGVGYLSEFPDEEELAQFDVIFLGDIGISSNQLTVEQGEWITKAVKENAAGLILMPGSNGWQQTLTEQVGFQELYPVSFNGLLGGVQTQYRSKLKISSSGQSSLLMSLASNGGENRKVWNSLPGIHWYEPVASVKAGGTILASHSKERNEYGAMPIIVTNTVGRGKVLWMGMDSSWEWRRGVEDLYHYRFWRQMARWMAYQRSLTEGSQSRLFLDASEVKEGYTSSFYLTAMTKEGKPAQPEETRLRVTYAGGEQEAIPLLESQEWGEYSGVVKFSHSGLAILDVMVQGEVAGSQKIHIMPGVREYRGEAADHALLRDVSQLTRAQHYVYGTHEGLVAQLKVASQPQPRFTFVKVAHQWGWYFGILLLVSAAWILRYAAP